MGERWKAVRGYDGRYLVSDLGRVRTLRSGKLLKGFRCGCRDTRSYLAVRLYGDDGKSKLHYVHRLVAEAFCRQIAGADCVDHLNENKIDNRADNLEWVTASENSRRNYERTRDEH